MAIMSIKERIGMLEARVGEVEADKAALVEALDSEKANAAALAATLETFKVEAQKAIDEAQAKIVELEAKAKADEEAIKVLTAERDGLKVKVELIPTEDAGAGQAAVVDGTVPAKAEETVDHVAKVNSLSGAEKMAYYKAHKAEIDAAYRR